MDSSLTARRLFKKAVQQGRSVVAEPSFYVSRLTFHGSWERRENDAWWKVRLGAPGLGG